MDWLITASLNQPGHFLLVTGNGTFGLNGGIDVFAINVSTGALWIVGSPVQVGVDPAGIVTDFSDKFVYVPNTGDATVSAFAFNSTTGGFMPISGSPYPSGGRGTINGPQGIATDNQGKFVFVCNASNDISVFSITAGSGVLTPVSDLLLQTEGMARMPSFMSSEDW